MASRFYSLYSHDFIRIASCVPRMRVADVAANLSETIGLARQGDAIKTALMIFRSLAYQLMPSTIFSSRMHSLIASNGPSANWSKPR